MNRTIALTHAPSPRMEACQRTYVPQQPIDYHEALRQHAAYCQALARCDCDVRVLEVNLTEPDCAFLEDTAIVLDELIVLTCLGAVSRRGESTALEPVLREFGELARIQPPATIEGGDVLRIGRRLLVGLSQRTTAAGIRSFSEIARRFGYELLPVAVRDCLHFKTACTALPDGRLLVNPAWLDTAALRDFELVAVPQDEPWAANVALAGGKLLLPAAHRQTAERIQQLGFAVESVELSEFAKAEGGATCLSLLIPPRN